MWSSINNRTWNSKGYVLNFRTHPEVPDRIQRPYDKHKEYGLLERCQDLPVSQEQINFPGRHFYSFRIFIIKNNTIRIFLSLKNDLNLLT